MQESPSGMLTGCLPALTSWTHAVISTSHQRVWETVDVSGVAHDWKKVRLWLSLDLLRFRRTRRT